MILSGTAFLAYFTRAAGCADRLIFTWQHTLTLNDAALHPRRRGSSPNSQPPTWVRQSSSSALILKGLTTSPSPASVVLVSSNPTNLVLSGAFSLSFLSYAAHVVLPFLAASACVFPLLLVLFRSPALIPRRIDVPLSPAEVRAALVDPAGAVFGAVLLGVTLAVLVGVSTIGVPVYMVTVPPAVIMLVRDVRHDWSRRGLQRPLSPSEDDGSSSDDAVGVQSTAHELQELASRAPSTTPPSSTPSTPLRRRALIPRLQRAHTRLTRTFPTVAHIAARLPVALLPFAFLMFVLVQGLAAQGWVALFARWWAAWVRATGVLGAVGGMGFLACVMCNVRRAFFVLRLT